MFIDQFATNICCTTNHNKKNFTGTPFLFDPVCEKLVHIYYVTKSNQIVSLYLDLNESNPRISMYCLLSLLYISIYTDMQDSPNTFTSVTEKCVGFPMDFARVLFKLYNCFYCIIELKANVFYFHWSCLKGVPTKILCWRRTDFIHTKQSPHLIWKISQKKIIFHKLYSRSMIPSFDKGHRFFRLKHLHLSSRV